MPKRTGRPPKNGHKIIEGFMELYQEKYETEFRPNYGMIVSAEKVAPYYTMGEIFAAMDYFFKYNGINFYKFLSGIDEFLSAAKKVEEEERKLQETLKSTKDLINRIEEKEIGKS
jgi:hypothetical protein